MELIDKNYQSTHNHNLPRGHCKIKDKAVLDLDLDFVSYPLYSIEFEINSSY